MSSLFHEIFALRVKVNGDLSTSDQDFDPSFRTALLKSVQKLQKGTKLLSRQDVLAVAVEIPFGVIFPALFEMCVEERLFAC